MPQIRENPLLSEITRRSERWMVSIFNNETNSMIEVIQILIVATGCTFEEAEIETWEADTYGKARVHFGEKTDCERIAKLIASIGVETTVTPEWE
jgi:ATP-dependent Clp protease adapter protein ClpS